MSFEYIHNLPIPFLNDIYDAQVKYLENKRKAEKEAIAKSEADAANAHKRQKAKMGGSRKH